MLLDSWHYTHKNQNSRNEHSPKLDIQHVLVEVRLRGCSNCSQHQDQDNISACSVVFVKRLRVIHAAIKLRHIILRETNQSLDSKQDVCNQAQDRMRRLEMRAIMRELVIFDDDEASDQSVETEVIEQEMCGCTFTLLLGGMCWLQNNDRLGDGEQTGGVEEWVDGEEDQRGEEDGGPDGGYQQDDAGLGDHCRS